MMTDELRAPIQIAPNLQAGVLIGGHWVTVGYSKQAGTDGRVRYHWEIIFPDGSDESGDDLQSGCGGGNLTEGLKSLLCFLSACGESRAYTSRTGIDGENSDLFPERVAEFAELEREELAMFECEIDDD